MSLINKAVKMDNFKIDSKNDDKMDDFKIDSMNGDKMNDFKIDSMNDDKMDDFKIDSMNDDKMDDFKIDSMNDLEEAAGVDKDAILEDYVDDLDRPENDIDIIIPTKDNINGRENSSAGDSVRPSTDEKEHTELEACIANNPIHESIEKELGRHKIKSYGKSKNELIMDLKSETDNRSIYVGNLYYKATEDELKKHFSKCGTVNRISIMKDRYTGRAKGHAYIEFNEKESVQNALLMNNSEFKNRLILVVQKRTNLPGISTSDRPPRGRGYRDRYERSNTTLSGPYHIY